MVLLCGVHHSLSEYKESHSIFFLSRDVLNNMERCIASKGKIMVMKTRVKEKKNPHNFVKSIKMKLSEEKMCVFLLGSIAVHTCAFLRSLSISKSNHKESFEIETLLQRIIDRLRL